MAASQIPQNLPERTLAVSRGQGNLGEVEPRVVRGFDKLEALVSKPMQNPMPHSDFMALSKAERNEAKAGDPFIVWGAFNGDKRTRDALKHASAVVLDFDEETHQLHAALLRGDVRPPFDYVAHPTRSHTPEAPRLRIIVPSGRDMTRDEHQMVTPAIASFFPAKLDPSSTRAEQLMYVPVQNQGAEYKSWAYRGGGYFNPDYYLANPRSEVVTPTEADACNDENFSMLQMKQPHLRWTLKRVQHELLSHLDPNAAEWDRNRWLKLGMILHHQFDGSAEALELWDRWSSKDERVKDDGELMYQPGLCEKEWESFGRTTNIATIRTLIHWANEAKSAARKGHHVTPIASQKPGTVRFPLLSATDLANAPPMKWLVRGALPLVGLAALFGSSGAGKSFLTLDIAAAVAGGDPEWFGRRVTQCPVTYCALEGEVGMGKRVKAWAKHHEKPLPDRLSFMPAPFDLLDGACVAELAHSIESAGGAGGMVVLDTLNRAAPGADENSSVDMGNIIAAAKRLQDLLGGLVLLVHHTGKDATKGLRGHSSLHAALDGAIEVISTDSRREWRVAKSKDDETGTGEAFQLAVVPLGDDEHGDPITSCVVLPDETAQTLKRTKLPIGGNQKIALDVLAEPLRNSLEIGKTDAAEGRPCIRLDRAISMVAERMVCDQSKHKTARAKEAVKGLVTRGILGVKGDWLWRV